MEKQAGEKQKLLETRDAEIKDLKSKNKELEVKVKENEKMLLKKDAELKQMETTLGY